MRLRRLLTLEPVKHVGRAIAHRRRQISKSHIQQLNNYILPPTCTAQGPGPDMPGQPLVRQRAARRVDGAFDPVLSEARNLLEAAIPHAKKKLRRLPHTTSPSSRRSVGRLLDSLPA